MLAQEDESDGEEDGAEPGDRYRRGVVEFLDVRLGHHAEQEDGGVGVEPATEERRRHWKWLPTPGPGSWIAQEG